LRRAGFEPDADTFTGEVEAQSPAARVQLDDDPVLVSECCEGTAAGHGHPGRSDRVMAAEVLEVLQVIHVTGGLDMRPANVDDRDTGEFERALDPLILQSASAPDVPHTEGETAPAQIDTRIGLLGRARRLVRL